MFRALIAFDLAGIWAAVWKWIWRLVPGALFRVVEGPVADN